MEKRPDIQSEVLKAWRLATAPLRAMPTWVLAGAPKCGTSTLYDYLVDHPDCKRGFRKEPTNFLHYPGSRLRSAMNFPLRLGRSFSVGDASVEYFSHPDGPRNIHAVLPQARLIFLLRNPAERAWSDFRMFQKDGREHESFEAVVPRAVAWLRDPALAPLIDAASRQAFHPVRYVQAGLYARTIERWLEFFPREQCLFLFSEDFFLHPVDVVQSAFQHVGLRDNPVTLLPVARDGGGSASKMPDSMRQLLTGFYAPEDARLATLLGRNIPWR
jgi:hypothetical protein